MRGKVAVVSIPGSGTTFTNEMLSGCGLERLTWHLTEKGTDRLNEWDGKVVVPVRPPKKVAWTWAKLNRLANFDWDEMWELLPRLNKVHFFFIEERRDNELKLLSEYLEVDLETDWKPHNSNGDPGGCEFDGGLAQDIYDTLLARRYGDSTGHY